MNRKLRANELNVVINAHQCPLCKGALDPTNQCERCKALVTLVTAPPASIPDPDSVEVIGYVTVGIRTILDYLEELPTKNLN